MSTSTSDRPDRNRPDSNLRDAMKRPSHAGLRIAHDRGASMPALSEAVLRMIWQERQISRADIARTTGLSCEQIGRAHV